MSAPLDTDAIAIEWLNSCGPCDGGLPMGCSCSSADPRIVISALCAEVERLRAECDRLGHVLGTHADGHRCTCVMTDPGVYHGSNMHPPEWEQDPWCPTHPDVDFISSESREAIARLDRVEALPDHWEGQADANETHPKECRTLLSAAAELRATLNAAPAPVGEGR